MVVVVSSGQRENLLIDMLEARKAKVISVVGGGGKTSTIKRLAKEFNSVDRPVVVTTTTRLAASEGLAFEHKLFTHNLPENEWLKNGRLPDCDLLLLGSEIEAGKLKGIRPEEVDLVHRLEPHKHVLVEADGAAKKPFKAPASYEPVVPASSQMVIVLVGAWALGVPVLPEYVHRPQLIAQWAGINLGDPLTVEVAAKVILHPQSYPKSLPGGAEMVVLINGVDTGNLSNARFLGKLLQKEGVAKVLLTNVRQEPPVSEVIA